MPTPFIARTGEYFHADGIVDGERLIKERIDPLTGGRTGVAEEFHPGGCVDEYHGRFSEPAMSASLFSGPRESAFPHFLEITLPSGPP